MWSATGTMCELPAVVRSCRRRSSWYRSPISGPVCVSGCPENGHKTSFTSGYWLTYLLIIHWRLNFPSDYLPHLLTLPYLSFLPSLHTSTFLPFIFLAALPSLPSPVAFPRYIHFIPAKQWKLPLDVVVFLSYSGTNWISASMQVSPYVVWSQSIKIHREKRTELVTITLQRVWTTLNTIIKQMNMNDINGPWWLTAKMSLA